MAVLRGIYGKDVPEFDGCVLDWYERNGAWDSDWYAVVWDDEKGKVDHVEYDTTRAGGGGWCKIDATPDVYRKVYRYYYDCVRKNFDEHVKIDEAREVKKGDTAVVVRGRKVPKGTVGEVFWIGEVQNPYAYGTVKRAGMKVGEETVWVPYEYLEAVDWEKRVVTGKERKERIRNAARGKMTYGGLRCIDRRVVG